MEREWKNLKLWGKLNKALLWFCEKGCRGKMTHEIVRSRVQGQAPLLARSLGKLSPSRSFAPPPPRPTRRRRRPSRIIQRRAGEARERWGMATQTGVAASKVLILVGAGPRLITVIDLSPPSNHYRVWCDFPLIGCCFDTLRGEMVPLQVWRGRSCCGMDAYLMCWGNSRSV
jgi:hypothetical protein